MITRFVIEGLLVVAVIIGFIFEEKIALAERRFLKKMFSRSLQKKQRQEHIKLKMREARYQRQQMQREMEMLELGLDNRPSLKVLNTDDKKSAILEEEVA
ncbi:MAG: hypothetical protein IJG23_07260 [Clostridia bacterium]|nr:hypothetical protein [Clostridia bacterium]MBQ6381879.1 hypothetical protein [Clostridia bacterium]